jgi:hypothetical protein
MNTLNHALHLLRRIFGCVCEPVQDEKFKKRRKKKCKSIRSGAARCSCFPVGIIVFKPASNAPSLFPFMVIGFSSDYVLNDELFMVKITDVAHKYKLFNIHKGQFQVQK